MSTKPHGDDLKKRVIWLMTYRMVIVTLLMGASAYIHPKEGGSLLPHSIIPIYALLGTSYLLTILSLITITVVKEIDLFADIQVVADVLLATALVYVTGGIDSIFSFLYIFIIMGAGIVLHGRLVFLTASLSSILYGALLDLQYYGYLPQIESPLSQPQSYSDIQILYKIFINITAFYIVAFLSSYLFIQLKRTRERLREAEEAIKRAEKLSTMGKLAAGIAHEIRNPLASMSGSIEMLRDELELSQENRRLMDIVLRESERLNRLITDFLDYARPYNPEKKEIDFSCVVAETLEVLEKGLSKDQSIKVQKEIKSGVKVFGEHERLKEVLWNLFINAVQSMHAGGNLAISLDTYGGMAKVVVRDSGEGIDVKDINRVFEPFFTTKTYGTGLGLATVYRIVEAHGGNIRVDSENGKGSVFTVMLPLKG
jgi:two-component system sensor histidine kinase PilS (NtrC family)